MKPRRGRAGADQQRWGENTRETARKAGSERGSRPLPLPPHKRPRVPFGCTLIPLRCTYAPLAWVFIPPGPLAPARGPFCWTIVRLLRQMPGRGEKSPGKHFWDANIRWTMPENAGERPRRMPGKDAGECRNEPPRGLRGRGRARRGARWRSPGGGARPGQGYVIGPGHSVQWDAVGRRWGPVGDRSGRGSGAEGI